MRPRHENKRTIWICDFDGTLSPLVFQRAEAEMLPEAEKMLIELSRLPDQRVAVLSSRMLDDLAPRIRVPGVYLGGGSGAEWLLPDGRRKIADDKLDPLLRVRAEVIGKLLRLKSVPGVDVEDKKWSVAIHVRDVLPHDRESLLGSLRELAGTVPIGIFKGPAVFEIQLLPAIDKVFGVQTFLRMIDLEPESARIVYCGDDENDGAAMKWVIRHGGIAFSIGFQPLVPGAKPVSGPLELVREIRELARLGCDRGRLKHESL